jgi:hypothetical protein
MQHIDHASRGLCFVGAGGRAAGAGRECGRLARVQQRLSERSARQPRHCTCRRTWPPTPVHAARSPTLPTLGSSRCPCARQTSPPTAPSHCGRTWLARCRAARFLRASGTSSTWVCTRCPQAHRPPRRLTPSRARTRTQTGKRATTVCCGRQSCPPAPTRLTARTCRTRRCCACWPPSASTCGCALAVSAHSTAAPTLTVRAHSFRPELDAYAARVGATWFASDPSADVPPVLAAMLDHWADDNVRSPPRVDERGRGGVGG